MHASEEAPGKPMHDLMLAHAAKVFGLAGGARAILAELTRRAISIEPSPAPRLRELVAPALRDGDPSILDSVDPGAPLIALAILIVRGDGPWLDRAVELADDFWPRLVGHWPRSVPRARAPRPESLDALVLAPATREAARAAAASIRRAQGTVLVRGQRGSGRGALARAIADQGGRSVLEIVGAGVLDPRRLVREARWQQAIVVLDDLDLASAETLAAIEASGIAIVATCPTDWRGPRPADAVVDVPWMTAGLRAELWERAVRDAGLSIPAGELAVVAARHPLGPGDVIAATRSLVGTPAAQLVTALPLACRRRGATDVSGLLRTVQADESTELIANAAVARDLDLIVAWGRRRGARNVVGVGPRGLTCLFHGPPGTGKTLAASVVARRIDLELLRVDLSQVVDKYVGETEKRLERVFTWAERSGAALLFDEADALFGRRAEVKDARDRYANIETSFLLQRLEEHPGLCLLSTNFATGIDAAFYRRFAFVIEFERPGPAERLRLWQAQTRRLGQLVADDVDVQFLASRFDLAGGDVVNAAFAATLLAERESSAVAMRHLVIACWRELSKSGRLIDGRELQPWFGAVTEYLATYAPP